MKIYVCGPYSSTIREPRTDKERVDAIVQVEYNVNVALDASVEIIRRGHIPYIPHLAHWLEQHNERYSIRHGIRLSYEDYMRIDLAFLRHCAGLLFLGHSPGADRERDIADQIGKVIYYDTDDVPFADHVEQSVRNQAVMKTWA